MPIKIPDHLPAREMLQSENIFVMDESRAFITRYTTAEHRNFEFNAYQRNDRNAVNAADRQYTAASRLCAIASEDASLQEYVC